MGGVHRIAFIRWGRFSHVNRNVLEHLRLNFPRGRVDVVDLSELKLQARDKLQLFRSSAASEYGQQALSSKAALDRYAKRTAFFFQYVKEGLAKILSGRKYSCTIQTQSLFDAGQRGIPHFVYTDHTHLANLYYPGFDRAQLFSPAWIDLEKTIYRNAAMNFTMSSHVSRSLVEHYQCSPDRIQCVYVGSNIRIPADREPSDPRYAGKEILFVGGDWERKGGPLLARAYAQVIKKVPAAKLTIVGCRPALDLPNCRVLGRLPLARLAAHYQRASLFCMPTQVEPFGIAVLEALAHRLPVVSTRIGALPDMVEHGVSGYLVDPTDADALARYLVTLLGSPARCRQFGKAGFARMRERYTWKATGERIARTMKALVPASGR